MNSIVERLRGFSLTYSEQDEAADLIEAQEQRINELETTWRAEQVRHEMKDNRIKELEAQLEEHAENFDSLARISKEELAALRQRIADAPVVAWNYYYPNIGGGRNASTHLIPGVSPIGADALISKEDLQK